MESKISKITKTNTKNPWMFYFHWFHRNSENCVFIDPGRPQSAELIHWFNSSKIDGEINFSSTGYNDHGWATTIVYFNNSEDALLFMLVFG
jgi:GTP-dependent phosphoenolpyruvate carboxykinase